MITALLITIVPLAIPLGYGLGWLVAIGTFALGLSVTYRMLGERRAFRIVSCGLAAASNRRQVRCRACFAPLPRVTEVVTRCMFCSADNVVAYDLRPTLERIESAPTSVDDVLHQSARDRGMFAMVAVFARCGWSPAWWFTSRCDRVLTYNSDVRILLAAALLLVGCVRGEQAVQASRPSVRT